MIVEAICPGGGHSVASSACSGPAQPLSSGTIPVGGDGRAHDSDLWRTASHEGGHMLCHRYCGLELGGATLVKGPSYDGLVWGPKSVCALRGKAAFDAEDAPPAILAAQIAHVISSDLPGPGEPRDASVVFDVQAQIICLMGGGAAEAAVFGDRPLRSAASDLASAHALAQIVCRNEGSRSSFIEHCYQEALAIIEENKPVVLALAQALIDHPQRTLDAVEISAVISQTLAREALAAEQARRAVWRRTIENVTRFTAFDSAVPR
jgi:hypothetical protein